MAAAADYRETPRMPSLSGLTNASTAVQFVPVTLRAIDVNIIEHLNLAGSFIHLYRK